MTVVEGEYVVGNYIMDKMYIASYDALCVAGCRLTGPENEEYYLDRMGFQSLQIKTGLEVEIEGEFTHCTYPDGETEVFEITSEHKWYDRYWNIAEGVWYSDTWVDEFLKKRGTYVLSKEEADSLINKIINAK